MAQAATVERPQIAVDEPKADQTIALRKAFGTFATGVTVVTAQTPNGPIGMTANSFSSLSLDPPLVLWSVAKSSSRHDHFLNAEHFCINILSSSQGDICKRFAKSGHDFEGLDWYRGRNNIPLINGALCNFECETYALHEAGDHTLVIGRVAKFTRHEGGAPLCFSQGKFGEFSASA